MLQMNVFFLRQGEVGYVMSGPEEEEKREERGSYNSVASIVQS